MQNHADNCLLGTEASHPSLLWHGPHLLSRSTFRSSLTCATIWGNWTLFHPLTYMHFLTFMYFSPYIPIGATLLAQQYGAVNIPAYYPFYY